MPNLMTCDHCQSQKNWRSSKTHNPSSLSFLFRGEKRCTDLLRWPQPDCVKVQLSLTLIMKRTFKHVHSMVACKRSMNGINKGGVSTNKRRCPRMKSELHRDISTIFTMNSRAGCDIALFPRPRPYHFPDHQALFVSSCCNSRDKNTDINIFVTARWIAIIAMTPSTACDASHCSKNHYKGVVSDSKGNTIVNSRRIRRRRSVQ